MPWLTAGNYKSWHSQGPQAKNAISPHGKAVKIFSNDALHGAAAGSASPVDSAAVKEVYSDAAGTTLVGYAVYIKTAADTAPVDGGPNGDGSNWYYYETVSGMNYADGKGATACVPCHSAAASDTTTHAGHGDFTYIDP
jgi:hypothetical protein